MYTIEELKQEQRELNARLAKIAEEIEDIIATKINLSDVKPGTRVIYRNGTEVMTVIFDNSTEMYKLGGANGNPFNTYCMPWRTKRHMFDYLKDDHTLVKGE